MLVKKDKLKILILEDNQEDAELTCREITKAHILSQVLVVESKTDFIAALDKFLPDLILSDHTLPFFDSLEALRILVSRSIKIPFILVTGTMTEAFAIKLMKVGAWDYVPKDQLSLLETSIKNVMDRYDNEKLRQQLLYDSILNEAYMQEAERIAHYGSWEVDITNNKFKLSKEAYNILGYNPGETESSYDNLLEKVHPDEVVRLHKFIKHVEINQHLEVYKETFRLMDKDGLMRTIKIEFVLKHSPNGKLSRINGFIQSITEILLLEAKIAEYENRLQNRDDHVKLASICMLTPEGKITALDEELLNKLGYSSEDIINKPISFIRAKDEVDTEDLEVYLQSSQIEGRFEMKSCFIAKNGSRWWANVIVTKLLNKDGNTSSLVMVITDLQQKMYGHHN